MRLHNRYAHEHQQVGGGIPVWCEIPKVRISGGMIQNKIQLWEVLSAGSPVEYDTKTHKAKILRCWQVTAVDTSTQAGSSIITLKRTARTPEIFSGLNIMVAPSSITGKGKAVTVTLVDDTNDDAFIVTVPTADIDAVTVGKFLVEAAGTGTGQSMYCIPNNVTKEDTVGGNQNAVDIPRGVKYLFENTIPPMPDVVKANIPLVEWDWHPEKQ